jgi:hypothetical protein
MASAADLATRITELEERLAQFAGISQTSFDGQDTSFDHAAAQAELTRLRRELAEAQSTRRNHRFPIYDKGV